MRKYRIIGILLGFCAVVSAILLQSMPPKTVVHKKQTEQAKNQKSHKPDDQAKHTELSLLDSFLPASAQTQLHFEFTFIADIFSPFTTNEETRGDYLGTKLKPGKFLEVLLTALISPNAP